MDERYNGKAENIINSLKENGVDYIISVGYDRESSVISAEFAARHQNVYAAAAIHPHYSDSASKEDYSEFVRLAKNPKLVAIGETGLDYHYNLSPAETQKKIFLKHLELAQSLKLPVIIHLRDAYDDMLRLLRENKSLLTYGGVLHCYSGSAEMAKLYLDMGLYISFTGSVTFKNAKGLLEAVKTVPLDRILTETDCPYLTPEPFRGTLNYPHYVKYVAEKIAKIKGIDTILLNQNVKRNASVLFKRIKLHSGEQQDIQ